MPTQVALAEKGCWPAAHLVRHPDVPAEAFRDLWDTLNQGNALDRRVKNRRKNGDH